MRDFLSFRLAVQQGKVNPRKYPKIRKAMAEIEERFARAASLPLCTRCGLVPAHDLCANCCRELSEIWLDDPEFARELEIEDNDERMRLKLGVGE